MIDMVAPLLQTLFKYWLRMTEACLENSFDNFKPQKSNCWQNYCPILPLVDSPPAPEQASMGAKINLQSFRNSSHDFYQCLMNMSPVCMCADNQVETSRHYWQEQKTATHTQGGKQNQRKTNIYEVKLKTGNYNLADRQSATKHNLGLGYLIHGSLSSAGVKYILKELCVTKIWVGRGGAIGSWNIKFRNFRINLLNILI